MGIRGRRGGKPQAEAPTSEGALTGRTGERVTAFVLFLIAAFLTYVYFVFLPGQEASRQVKFDYLNPLLSTKVGDCIGARASNDPGSEMCLVVRHVVLRPSRGPERLPGHTDLRESLPYVALDSHVATSGTAGCSGERPETTLRAFNNFGLDPDSQVAVERIVPVWAKWAGGKEGILYEVTLRRFDSASMHISYISPEMPITGLVKQEVVNEDVSNQAYFYEIDCGR